MRSQLPTRVVDGFHIVELHRELDLSTAATIRDELLAVLHQRGPCVVLDLSDVDFMDSTGLSVLLATERRARLLGGVLRLVGVRSGPAKVLCITGLDGYFEIFQDEREAVATAPRHRMPMARPDCGAGPGPSNQPAHAGWMPDGQAWR